MNITRYNVSKKFHFNTKSFSVLHGKEGFLSENSFLIMFKMHFQLQSLHLSGVCLGCFESANRPAMSREKYNNTTRLQIREVRRINKKIIIIVNYLLERIVMSVLTKGSAGFILQSSVRPVRSVGFIFLLR